MMTRKQLQALPKCELHRHLDGSVRLETIINIAQRHNLDLDCTREELHNRATISAPKSSLDEVLQCFSITQQVLCNYKAIKQVAFENVEDAYRDGVKLLELRFAPTFIAAGKEGLENDEIIEGVLDGIGRGMDRYNIQVGLIGIIPRTTDHAGNRRATEDFVRYARGNHRRGARICGFDLADNEMDIPHREFVPFVDMARASGLGITIHTGENSNAPCVELSLNLYRPDRIGHGIRCIDDDALVKRIREERIMLELCPTSNWLTHSVPSIEEHPLPLLYKRGVPLSINADDPRLMNIDLVHEYEVCNLCYGLEAEDFMKINRNAVSHSFLPEEIREHVMETWF